MVEVGESWSLPDTSEALCSTTAVEKREDKACLVALNWIENDRKKRKENYTRKVLQFSLPFRWLFGSQDFYFLFFIFQWLFGCQENEKKSSIILCNQLLNPIK